MSLEARIVVDRGDFRLAVKFICHKTGVVMGPRRAGKSLLLRAILGAVTPTEGAIRLDRELLFEAGTLNVAPEARAIAYVPKGGGLFPNMTVIENAAFAVGGAAPALRRVRALLAELGVADLADRPIGALSGEEVLRVALVRAIARPPRLLLLDEPLAALEPAVRPAARRFLGRWLARRDHGSLMVTDDPADAAEIADYLIVLEAGRVVQKGRLDDVAVRPATELVAALTPGLLDRRPGSIPPPSIVSEDE